MSGITDSPMPNIATSRDQLFARIPVDPAQTSFFEGREFRFNRKITSPVTMRFISAVDFILSYQHFTIADGEFEFYAWRSSNVTPSGTWSTLPFYSKNISAEYKEFNGGRYQSQVTIESGGTITVADAEDYADFAWLKTAGGTGNQVSVGDQSTQGRYLAAGTYYLQFVGVSAAAYHIEWEERP